MTKILISSFALILFLSTSMMALNPSKEYKYTPDKFGMNFKEEKIKTSDNATLNAWFFENSKITTNWMVISGSGDGNMADNLELVNSFLSTGYNVVTYDYRGYGSSSEFKIDPDLYIYPQFITDLNAVLDHLRKTRSIAKFDLYGLNIGAGLSIGVGANRVETKRIIADGPWHNLEGMKKKIKDQFAKDILLPFGFDKNFEPMYAMDKPKSRLLGLMIIISDQDPLISMNEIKTIKGVTDTYVVRNSTANDQNFSTDKNEYFNRISKFLSK
ncbi:MAG TPA: alpha/beta hydrolase [Bacteroidia bacterium]|nr:alpha/beta hydrolase [Bacteroidia bacterium]HNT80363.1 alpha/beta hydrolase [Bacteroidia bacterium]